MTLNSLSELLAALSVRGIECRRDGDELVVKAAKDSLDATLVEALREHKAELLERLTTHSLNSPNEQGDGKPWLKAQRRGVRTSEVAVPLTPIQQWFFDCHLEAPESAVMSFVFACGKRIEAAMLRQALAEVVVIHDAFRLSFKQSDNGRWLQEQAPKIDRLPFESINLASLPEPAQRAELSRIQRECVERLKLDQIPLFEAALVDLGERCSQRFILVAHRLIFDGRSLAIVLEDVEAVYERILRGMPSVPTQPANVGAFRMWAEHLSAYGNAPVMSSHLSYWSSLPWSKVRALPRDFEQASNSFKTARQHISSLDASETKQLREEVRSLSGSQPFDLLLAALMDAYGWWTGRATLAVDMEGPHCREFIFDKLNLERAVGWFSSTFPIVLDVSGATGTLDILSSVKRQLRATLLEQKRVMPGAGIQFDDDLVFPLNGVCFGALRYMSSLAGAESLASYPEAEIGINHDPMREYSDAFGVDPGMFRWDGDGNTESVYSHTNRRKHLLYLTGSIVGGCFQTTWTYSDACHRPETVKRLSDRFMQAMRTMLQETRRSSEPSTTNF